MRRALAACALVASLVACAGTKPAWELPPPEIVQGPIVPAERVHRARLANGLDVLVLEDHALPRLTVGVVARRGAGSEMIEEAGVASLALDAMKRGAGRRDALALARAVDEIGGRLATSAGWDSVSVGVGGLSEDADRLYEVLADVVLRPRFDAAEVARAKAEQLAGFEQEKDEPHAVAARALQRALYDGHRYGVSLDGAPASVAALDAADLRAWHAKLFTPEQSIAYVVGDVDTADALARLRAHFDGWAPGPGVEHGPPPPTPAPPAARVVLIDRPDQQQATLLLAHEGIARRDPTRITANLVNTILGGGGFLSRLMSRARAEEGLVYGVSSSFSMRWHAGPFTVSTSTRVSEAGRTVDLLRAELAGMHERPPTDADLRQAKSYMAGSFVLGLETSAAIAGALVDLDVYGLQADSLDTYRTRLAAVTRDDVVGAAERLLHPERMVLVAVGPAAALRPQLERFGPVEVAAP